MLIVPFDLSYLDDQVDLFVRVYSEPGRVWDPHIARLYLLPTLTDYPDFCATAVHDDGTCMGSIVARPEYLFQGKTLYIDALQVHERYRKQGVAKALIKHILAQTKKDTFLYISFQADTRKEFPQQWYKKLGFKESGWMIFDAPFKSTKI